jgi:hypothetical protein
MKPPDGREDRRAVDGESGRGDMLGGLTTGAGGQLGLPADVPADDERVITFPVVPTQPTRESAESETDAARPEQSATDPAE